MPIRKSGQKLTPRATQPTTKGPEAKPEPPDPVVARVARAMSGSRLEGEKVVPPPKPADTRPADVRLAEGRQKVRGLRRRRVLRLRRSR